MLAVHWALDRWSATQGEIRDAILQHTGPDSVLVTNMDATAKFIERRDRTYYALNTAAISPRHAAALVRRHGELFVALLDRSDSSYWRSRLAENAAYIDALRPAPKLELDRRISPTERLRIWRVTEVRVPD